MKNLFFAIMMIAAIALFSSCEATSDPGYDGPCTNCGSNGGGQYNVSINGGQNGGGNGSGNGGINNGSAETLHGYVYDLDVTTTVTVFPVDGSESFSVPVSTNLRNQMAQYLNLNPLECEKRFYVNIVWIQNMQTYQWLQRAESGSPAPDCN